MVLNEKKADILYNSIDNNLTYLYIKDLLPGLRVALVYDVKNENGKTVQGMKEFLKSSKWRKGLESNDFIPVFFSVR